MTVKSKIVEVIGGEKADLLVSEKVRRALQANERVKYLLTLLQLAQAQARSPSPQPDDLSVERRRAGIESTEFDQVVPRARLSGDGELQTVSIEDVLQLALDETAKMCEPLIVGRRAEGEPLKGRLKRVEKLCRPWTRGREEKDGGGKGGGRKDGKKTGGGMGGAATQDVAIPMDFIGRLTSGDRGGPDTLHLIVMDAHKAINSLISELSGRRETIGGADTLGLAGEDHELVAAFMEGVNSTSYLKGNHPGLATTAVRMGDKLMIQNDVGETDAHVIILEILDDKDRQGVRRLEITYTDVHAKRTDFFAKLLGDLSIDWKKTESRFSAELTESAFSLTRGVLKAKTAKKLSGALRTIGSSLVFLIDWNKARKRLRNFVRGAEALDILLWAARNRVGHMAFLSYGDVELIYEALEALPRGTVRRGEPFTAILGRKGALEFLKETLRLSVESYERKEPRALLLDRLRCLLLARAQRRGLGADEMLLELAGLCVEATLTFRDALRSVMRPVKGLIARSHERICRWEERADERLNRIRKTHLKEPQPLLPVGVSVDDALDALEDAVDMAHALETHLDLKAVPEDLFSMLEEGSEMALHSAQLFFRIFERYRELLRGGMPEALFDLINELKKTEQQGDNLKRDMRWKLLSGGGDARYLMAVRDVGERIETAINALKRAGFLIHDLAYTAMEKIHG